MKKYLLITDSAVLGFFQKISDWSKERFGINNFTIARVLKRVILFFGIMELIFERSSTGIDPISIFLIGVLIGFSTLMIKSFPRTDSVVRIPFINIYSVTFKDFRMKVLMFMLLLMVSNIILFIFHAGVIERLSTICMTITEISFVSLLYLGCCIVKPLKSNW